MRVDNFVLTKKMVTRFSFSLFHFPFHFVVFLLYIFQNLINERITLFVLLCFAFLFNGSLTLLR